MKQGYVARKVFPSLYNIQQRLSKKQANAIVANIYYASVRKFLTPPKWLVYRQNF